MKSALQNLAEQMRSHVAERVLPFWLEHGLDNAQGGFVTTLERDGAPGDAALKRLADQARMIDAFSRGAAVGDAERCLEAAGRGYEFLESFMYASEEGRWHAAVDRNGAPAGGRIYAFDLTAVVLGLSSYAVAGAAPEALATATTTAELLEMFFRDRKHGGWFDSLNADWEADDETRSLDVHLHGAEALLELYHATEEPRWRDELRALAALMLVNTIDEGAGPVVVERFCAEGAWEGVEEDLEPETTVDFGHVFKAAWLAMTPLAGSGRPAYLEFARRQLEFAMRWGVDPAAGVYASAQPSGAVLNARYGWWRQCNALAALARATRVFGPKDWLPHFERLWEWCLDRFHDERHGEWFAELGAQGAVTDSRKGTGRKSAYPLVEALLSAADDLDASAL